MKRILLAALALAACAPASAGQACLRMNDIYSWHEMNDQTLIVENIQHQKFKLTLLGHCPNLNFHETLAFKAVGGDELSCIGSGDMVIQHDVIGPQRCAIKNVELYTPEMQKADVDAAKAKGTTTP